MNKKILSFFTAFLFQLFAVVSQNTPIPNQPNDIRILPENYKDNYQSSDYDYTESVSLITKFKIWFFQKLSDLFQVDNENAYDIFYTIRNSIYFLIVGFAVFLLYKMILGKELRWFFKRKPAKNLDPDYVIDEDIQSVDFDELIANAVKQTNYRLAIKYHYFYLLKKLDEASIIKYDPQKTTYDYQLDLEGTQHNSIFSKAAYYYTYIWYGEFSIDANEYQTTSNTFTQLLKSLKDE